MDPISVIAADSVSHLQQAAADLIAPATPFVDEVVRVVGATVMPVIHAAVAGVAAVENFTGPQMFTTILLVCGGFLALALGSAVTHRYP